jgi:hypothetical protein
MKTESANDDVERRYWVVLVQLQKLSLALSSSAVLLRLCALSDFRNSGLHTSVLRPS